MLSTAAVSFGAPVEVEPISVESAGTLSIIRGVVRDEGGSPIADASVAIFRAGTSKLLKQVNSGSDGSYFAKILPGTYTVLAVAQGFNPVTLFGVEVARASDLTYGFKLERSGGGNTLPEKRLDKNSSRWRIRAAQTQRSIYQNTEGDLPVDVTASVESKDDDELSADRKGQSFVETYFENSPRGAHSGVKFASLFPVSENAEFVVAGQAGVGHNIPLRLESAFTYRPNDSHQLRFNTSAGRLGTVAAGNGERLLGQVSVQALDEWKVREGIILVFGIDYARFVGASDSSSLSPRLGLQFDLDSKTRFRTAFTTQTEDRSWAQALDLEGSNVLFAEPTAIEDLTIENGRVRMNKSRRLEFGVERILDSRSSIEANAFWDTTFAKGVGLTSIIDDTLTGESVANQQGRSEGLRVVYSRRLNGPFTASAGYSFGSGQRISRYALTDPSHIFESDFFQSFFAQLALDLDTGTSVRTIYRLSPEATIFAIDPFKGRLAIFDPGLSVLVTQSLPNLGLPFRAQAVIDARNVFDIQPGVIGDEGSLRVGSFGRTLKGAIQVRF